MGLPSKGSGALPNILEGAGVAMVGARGARTGEPAEAGDAGVAELVDVEGVSVGGGEGVGARDRGTTGGRMPRGLGTMEEGLGLSGRLPGTRRGESWCETSRDGLGLGGVGVLVRET